MSPYRARPTATARVALSLCVLIGALAASCGERAHRVGAAGDDAPTPSRFVLRGRWERPAPIRVAVDPASAPASVEVAELEAALASACASWSALSPAELLPVGRVGSSAEARAPPVVVSWQRGEHGPCPLFGTDSSVAHSGPVESGTFVHLDADRAWASSDGPSLEQTLLHELGHVLGLGHSADGEALLHVAPRATAPARSDVDALHTLYGGGELDAGDLVITRDGARLAVVHGLAPPDAAGYGLLDVDADGRDELVLWRADFGRASPAEGAGDLCVLHFGAGAQPVRSSGPFLAFVLPEVRVELLTDAQGTAYVRQRGNDGTAILHAFRRGGDGLEAVRSADLSSGAIVPRRLQGDLDGDGTLEVVGRPQPASHGERDLR